jgi:hypothetical protein
MREPHLHISRTDRRNASRQGWLPLMRSARQSRAVGRLLVARKVPTSKPSRVTRLNLSWLIRQGPATKLDNGAGLLMCPKQNLRNCQALSDVRGRRRKMVGWIGPTSLEQTHPYSVDFRPPRQRRMGVVQKLAKSRRRRCRASALDVSATPRACKARWVKKIHHALSSSWTSEKCQRSEGPGIPRRR